MTATKGRPTVTLQLPRVLEPAVGRLRMRVQGHTIVEALECAFAEVPALRHHLHGESGALRPHILCIVNDRHVERSAHATLPLAAGDEILIHQAISGG